MNDSIGKPPDPATEVAAIPWFDPVLGSTGDDARRAGYRRLQSLWRETVLNVPPADRAGGGPVGNMLPAGAPASAQWLTGHIASYVERRLAVKQPGDASIEPNRLQRNLLSSMPLCFNVFGQLAAFPSAGARVLASVLDMDIARLNEIRVEYAPVKARAALGDVTAFDAFVSFTASDGTPGFLAVETKYTEPFSPKEYLSPAYRATTEAPGSWFVAGATDVASGSATNQLWRNAMLAQLTAEHHPEHGTGVVVVLTADHDAHAVAAVAGIQRVLKQPQERLRHVLLEDVVACAKKEPSLQLWAALFAARYLTPIPPLLDEPR